MTNKKKLSVQINECLPDDGGDIDFTKLTKDELILLANKLDILYNQILDGGGEIIEDMLSKRVQKNMSRRLDLDKDEENIVGAFIKNRMKKGPIIGLIKQGMKKRIMSEFDSDKDSED